MKKIPLEILERRVDEILQLMEHSSKYMNATESLICADLDKVYFDSLPIIDQDFNVVQISYDGIKRIKREDFYKE